MMISTKGRYALRMLVDMAEHERGNTYVPLKEIAARQEISEKYISRLIIELRKAGFVKSVRGANGGYTLTRRPEDISVLEVLEVMEGPIAIVDCTSSAEGICHRKSLCPAQRMWAEINQKIRSAFAAYTLKDLLELYVSNGETVILSDIQGRMIDMVTYDLLSADTSWGRDEEGDGSFKLFYAAFVLQSGFCMAVVLALVVLDSLLGFGKRVFRRFLIP